MSLSRTFIFPLILGLLILTSCATSEPDFGDPQPPQEDDTDLADILDDTSEEDLSDATQDDADPEDIDDDADQKDSDDPIELCPFGCEPNETCTDDGCVDLCNDAGYQCGDWTLRGHDVQCGTCPSGTCNGGQCVDICADFPAQCGEIYWEGEAQDCGGCSGFERCRDNQCAEPEHFIDLAAGQTHTCALRPNFEVRCWGDNEFGQLGSGSSRTNSPQPLRVTGLASVKTLRSHSNHTCATLDSSHIQCWGRNSQGQLGDLKKDDQPQPVSVANLSNSTDNATGATHTCSLQKSGRVRCWGDNSQGQLGKGDQEPSLSNNLVRLATAEPLEQVQSLALGSAFSCALREDNKAYCWGFNNHGQLGGGDNISRSLWARPVELDQPLSRIAAGTNHACAIAVGGNIYCWGQGAMGQIGDDSTQSALSPRLVDLPARAISISAGQHHSCAALETGAVYCWGDNTYGQLGQRNQGGNSTTPRLVQELDDVHIVVCGAHHTCALDRSGQVHCWGRNHRGQLGDGTTTSRGIPAPISN